MIVKYDNWTWIEKNGRACLMEGTRLVWWGDPKDGIYHSPNIAPLEVLLFFSKARLDTR